MPSPKFYFLILSLLFVCCNANNKGGENNDSLLPGNDSLLLTTIDQADLLSIDSLNHKAAIDLLTARLYVNAINTFSDTIRALTYHKLGTYYYRAKLNGEARAQLDTAINIWGNPESSSGVFALAKSYFVRAASFENDSYHRKALEDISQANLLLGNVNGHENTKGNYFAKTGFYYSMLQEKEKAQEYFDQAAQLLMPNTIELAQYLNIRAQVFEAEENSDQAIHLYDQAIAIYDSVTTNEELGFAVKVNRLAILIQDQEYPETKKQTEAFLLSFTASTRYMLQEKSTVVKNLAFYAWRAGEYTDSRKYYLQVLDMVNELSPTKNTRKHALAFEGLGDVDDSLGGFDTSIEYYQKAIESLSIGFNPTNINNLPNLKDHIIIHEVDLERIIGFKIAVLYKKYKSTKLVVDLMAVFDNYVGLDLIWTQMRQGYKAAMSRFDLIEKNIPQYEEATNVALELYRLTNDEKFLNAAYQFASKNKAVVMLDGIQDETAKFHNIDDANQQKERLLKKEIYDLNSSIFDLTKEKINGDTRLTDLKNERFKKERNYESHIKYLERNFPKYYDLKYSLNQTKSYKTEQEQLPNQAAVIEYFVGVDSVYTFCYSKNIPLKVFTQIRDKKFDATIDQFGLMIKKTNKYTMKEFSITSRKVYELLLEDVLVSFGNSIDRLFIIPDDKLMQISFDVLLTEQIILDNNDEWTDSLPYLLRKYALSYAYSNQLLFSTKNDEPTNSQYKPYLGFGLEYDDFTLEGVKDLQPTEVDTLALRGMGKLVYSVDEIRESASMMKGESYLNKKAIKKVFLDRCSNAKILHLAMHGFVVKEKPMNSGLIFTRESDEDDFILKASDIYSTKLIANLAVLSACHSGDGTIHKGEGIRSLARAFNYAGCPNVTASLWTAPDLSTKKIILEFYRNINKQQPIDVALQNAKLNYLDQCKFNNEALPHLWSHLVTIGETRAISN